MKFKRAVIEVNGGCNYSCGMCPQSSPGRSKNFLKKLSLENFNTILEQIGDVECIQLEGSGEATLMSNLPDYIYEDEETINQIKSFYLKNKTNIAKKITRKLMKIYKKFFK